jgi:Flp pilus assembly protein TadG
MRTAMTLRRLRSLGRDQRGASVIEFALFAPVLAMMVMGISDIAMGYSRKLVLEGAAYRALEKVAVGSAQTDYSALRTEAATAAGVPESAVTVDNWLACNGTRQTDFVGVCPAGEEIARYVQVNITSSYTPRFNYGPLYQGRAVNGVVPISVSTSLRIQ